MPARRRVRDRLQRPDDRDHHGHGQPEHRGQADEEVDRPCRLLSPARGSCPVPSGTSLSNDPTDIPRGLAATGLSSTRVDGIVCDTGPREPVNGSRILWEEARKRSGTMLPSGSSHCGSPPTLTSMAPTHSFASASPRRLRVLFLIDSLIEDGGAERIAIGLATHLPKARFDVWVCSTRSAEVSAMQTLQRAGVKHVNLGRSSKWDLYRLGALITLVRRERFDVLHAHKFGSNLWGTLIGRVCRVPVVLAHEHTWSYEGNPIRKWLDGLVIGRLATRFIAVSSLDAQRMVSIEHVPPEKVVLLPNGYMPRPSLPDDNFRQELGIDARTPLIAAVTVLRPQKAISVLLEAHARVLEEMPEARLVLAGGGAERSALETRTKQLGLQDRVHFLGYRSDVDSILRASDIAAMSSDYEGTPVVSFECMANRTPLVATAVGGLPDVIEHGRTGLLVPPRDPQALADAILSLLRDPARREQMGTDAAKRLPEFTIGSSIERLSALYEALIAESRASSDLLVPVAHA